SAPGKAVIRSRRYGANCVIIVHRGRSGPQAGGSRPRSIYLPTSCGHVPAAGQSPRPTALTDRIAKRLGALIRGGTPSPVSARFTVGVPTFSQNSILFENWPIPFYAIFGVRSCWIEPVCYYATQPTTGRREPRNLYCSRANMVECAHLPKDLH